MSSSLPPSPQRQPWQPPSPEQLQPELPAYELLGLLGRGGMGAVYRARQRSLKREVAIKVLPPMIEDGDMRFADRFKAEAQSMAQLNHPGIISVFDAGETPGGLLYFVMEYVQGTDVQQMIYASGKLSPEYAHAISANVCEALAYAHENGLIHRDIKPANIMVDMKGRVKVADFGLAKMTNENSGLTQSNVAVGTPDFVAPEALASGVPLDGRADLYAVGVMLYQMLTGEIPRGMFAMPSELLPGIVDPRFDAVVARAMQTDRTKRYATAMELRADLDSALLPLASTSDLQQLSNAAALNTGPVEKPSLSNKQKTKKLMIIGLGTLASAAIAVVALNHSTDKAIPEAPRPAVQASIPAEKPVDAPAPTAVAAPEKSAPVAEPAPAPTNGDQVGKPPRSSVKSKRQAGGSSSANSKPLVIAQAAPPPEPPAPQLPPELAVLDQQFHALQKERVTNVYDADLAKLNASYLGGISKKIAAEKAAGHLDAVLALEAEKKLIDSNQPMPVSDDPQMDASVKALRAIYRSSLAQLNATRLMNLKSLTGPLNTRLVQMEADLTKADRVTDAKTVRSYRESLGQSDAPPAAQGSKPVAAAPTGSTKNGFTNSLGMKFVPVPDTKILMCIHETRYQDYTAYAAGTEGVDPEWKNQSDNGYQITERNDEHPVINVDYADAKGFCEWLSKKEGKTYRLPTDREWGIAVGIGREEKWKKDTVPATVSRPEGEYPWGRAWPPPAGAGNYSDASRRAKAPRNDAEYLDKYDDGYPTTAPVMSYKPNKLGIYDLGGNVWEWVEDWMDDGKADRVLRGSCWKAGTSPQTAMSGSRFRAKPDRRRTDLGFRVVIDEAK